MSRATPCSATATRGVARALAAACLSLACAAPPLAKTDAPAAAEPHAPGLAPPDLAPRTLAVPESTPRPPALRLLEATRFTLLLQDADLRGVLLGLGRESPLNVVVAPDVTGTVSADLSDVSLLEILDQLVAGRGYRYAVEGNLLRIFREDRETRIFKIDYPSYTRKGDTRVSLAGFVGSTVEVGGQGGTGGGGGAGGGTGGAQDTSVSQIETQQTTDLWSEIESAVRTIVFGAADATSDTKADDRSGESALAARRVIVSRQSGLVSVTAERFVLAEVERYLDAVARSTQRQVLIDAQIIEVRLGDDLDLGLDIEGAPNFPGDTVGIFKRMLIPGMREATIAQSLAPVLNSGGISIGIANESFGLILRAIAKQTDVRVLSTPRVSTLEQPQGDDQGGSQRGLLHRRVRDHRERRRGADDHGVRPQRDPGRREPRRDATGLRGRRDHAARAAERFGGGLHRAAAEGERRRPAERAACRSWTCARPTPSCACATVRPSYLAGSCRAARSSRSAVSPAWRTSRTSASSSATRASRRSAPSS